MNVGEELVSAYLEHVLGCEFVQMNLYTVETQGEIDVVGINLKKEKLYVCEVAIHLSTGLQYTKDKRPNNVQKLTDKFSRDIQYAETYFKNYEKHFMLWSPIVKQRGNPEYDQMGHLIKIGSEIKRLHGETIEFMVNERFLKCLNELRQVATMASADLKSPVMRLLQIEQQLEKHVAKLGVQAGQNPEVSK